MDPSLALDVLNLLGIKWKNKARQISSASNLQKELAIWLLIIKI